MFRDLVYFIEDCGGLLFVALLFYGVGVYFVFTLDPFIGMFMIFVPLALFAVISFYRIVAFFTGI